MIEKEDIKEILDFVHTTVEVRTPGEYLKMIAVYESLGAEIWAWHGGYKEPEEDPYYPYEEGKKPHSCYGWEPCGILKVADIGASSSGTFSSVDELIDTVRRVIGSDTGFDRDSVYSKLSERSKLDT